jgi:hypothetical protein
VTKGGRVSTQPLRSYLTRCEAARLSGQLVPDGIHTAFEDLKQIEEERAWLERGMRMARARHLHNEAAAAEALTVWTLNGNNPDEWNPRPDEWGTASEERFRAHIRTNLDIGAITAGAHDDYLPRANREADAA